MYTSGCLEEFSGIDLNFHEIAEFTPGSEKTKIKRNIKEANLPVVQNTTFL